MMSLKISSTRFSCHFDLIQTSLSGIQICKSRFMFILATINSHFSNLYLTWIGDKIVSSLRQTFVQPSVLCKIGHRAISSKVFKMCRLFLSGYPSAVNFSSPMIPASNVVICPFKCESWAWSSTNSFSVTGVCCVAAAKCGHKLATEASILERPPLPFPPKLGEDFCSQHDGSWFSSVGGGGGACTV